MSKLKAIFLNKWIMVVPALIIIFVSIGFVEKKQQVKTLQHIYVDIENQLDNYYINEEDVISLITDRGQSRLVGMEMEDLNLRMLENKVKKNLFVKKADAYKDLKGNLIVNVEQRRPIARFLRGGTQDFYLADDGQVLPVSTRYSSRVVMIGGGFAKKIKEGDFMQNEHGKAIFELLNFVRDSEFWMAQIAEINIDSKGYIVLYPQLGKQVIEFGPSEDIEKKLSKLRIFYEEIIPRKGWDAYSRVNLQYADQIICE